MTIKKDAQFSFEECFCAEMMARMMPQEQKNTGDACAELMALFSGSQGDGKCLEVMSRMKSVCCDAGQESDENDRKA